MLVSRKQVIEATDGEDFVTQELCVRLLADDEEHLILFRGFLADMHDYGRTRIRICRGWAVNATLIVVSLNFLLSNQFSETSWYRTAATAGTLCFLSLSFASWSSWRMLCGTEYLKIREHAEYLRSQGSSIAGKATVPLREAA